MLVATLRSLRKSLVRGRVAMQSASLSTAGADRQEQEQAAAAAVLLRSEHYARVLTLNRPKALNALNEDMVRLLTEQVARCERASDCSLIILRSDHPRALCAGGDVKSVVRHLREGNLKAHADFFREEYALIYALANLRKPFVSLMHGYTMGGGMGVSAHAAFRVVTETARLAMPETAIGLFPDVGGSHLLARLPGGVGVFMALTGYQMSAAEALAYGLASHHVPARYLPDLVDRLATIPPATANSSSLAFSAASTPVGDNDNDNDDNKVASSATATATAAAISKAMASPGAAHYTTVNFAIEEFAAPLVPDVARDATIAHRALIDRVFSAENDCLPDNPNGQEITIEVLLSRLAKEASDVITNSRETRQFAAGVLETLSRCSPLSLRVTLRLIRRAKTYDFRRAMEREWALVNSLGASPEFVEGVTAKLIEKRAPKWAPPAISDGLAPHLDPRIKETWNDVNVLWNTRPETESPYPALPPGDNKKSSFCYESTPFAIYNMPSEEDLARMLQSSGRKFKDHAEFTEHVVSSWPSTEKINKCREQFMRMRGAPAPLLVRRSDCPISATMVGKVGLAQHVEMMVNLTCTVDAETESLTYRGHISSSSSKNKSTLDPAGTSSKL